MADVGAAVDTEGVEDVEEVLHVSVECGVAAEVKIIGVDRAGADEVEENNPVIVAEEGEDPLPRRLIGAEAMGKNQNFLAGTHHSHVQSLQQTMPHYLLDGKQSIQEPNFYFLVIEKLVLLLFFFFFWEESGGWELKTCVNK